MKSTTKKIGKRKSEIMMVKLMCATNVVDIHGVEGIEQFLKMQEMDNPEYLKLAIDEEISEDVIDALKNVLKRQ